MAVKGGTFKDKMFSLSMFTFFYQPIAVTDLVDKDLHINF